MPSKETEKLNKQLRESHCTFAVLNSAGRCVADCQYNRATGFRSDCMGNCGTTNGNSGHEIQLKGRRHE